MKIKKYLVSSVQEGMAQVRREMGPDAVIIETRKRRQRGIRGFFLPRKVEITAAVDAQGEQPADRQKRFFNADLLMEKELAQIKTMMKKVLSQQGSSLAEGDGPYPYWLRRLIQNDVHQEYAVDLLAGLQDVAAGKENHSEVMETLLLSKIAKSIPTDEVPPETRFFSFVGPTGVGKTTTLVKLAANAALRQGKKTVIITVDTYRIGAVEQLKTYMEITGIPLEVVYTVRDMKETLERYKGYDNVFVDTAGRSARNTLQLSETAQYMNCLQDSAVFLVISATTKMRDLHRIADNFRRCGYNRLIVTKIDETETYGTILNACRLTSLPVTYVTTGQSVPDDIERADSGRLAEMVLGEEYDG